MTETRVITTVCTKCGFEVPDRSRFCGRCGSYDLSKVEDNRTPTLSDFVECSSCHAFREVDGDFCEHCGAKVSTESAVAPGPPTADPIEPTVANRATPSWVIFGTVGLGVLLVSMVTFLLAQSSTRKDNTNQNNRNINQNSSPTPLQPERYKGMVFIAGGEFMMGDDKGDEYEYPAHRVVVQSFLMDQTEVTCAEYDRFLKESSRKPPLGWQSKICPPNLPDLPATGVNWFDATAYATWRNVRLPTEEEWEFAARSTDGRKYPWGNTWLDGSANVGAAGAQRLVNVGTYSNGKTPSGLLDMAGNAWEWTSSQMVGYPKGKLSITTGPELKVIRGGSWQDQPSQVTTTYRGYLLSSGAEDYSATGFRCVADVRPTR